MPRGGARSTSGRKPMEGARRVNIVLDASTREILTAHGGKSGKGAFIREAMVSLLEELAAGAQVVPVPVHGETGDFPLKAPEALLGASQLQVGPGQFFSLSEFIRTAIQRDALKRGGQEMEKIPTVFARDPENRGRVIREVTPGCEWVFDDPAAVPTRKYDGTCTMLDIHGKWWARREVKAGKIPPANFVAVQSDPATGKTVGWEPIEQSGFVRWHADALGNSHGLEPGTYELLGPKINGNPEEADAHYLVRHAHAQRLEGVPSEFEALADWLRTHPYEGIVWHHPDGRMAKLKKRDF